MCLIYSAHRDAEVCAMASALAPPSINATPPIPWSVSGFATSNPIYLKGKSNGQRCIFVSLFLPLATQLSADAPVVTQASFFLPLHMPLSYLFMLVWTFPWKNIRSIQPFKIAGAPNHQIGKCTLSWSQLCMLVISALTSGASAYFSAL